jgi:hypothetical protein
MNPVEKVEDLVGEQINAVCFVMDYLELHFNGPILRALVAAVLETPTERWFFPEPGSREGMCSIIGATVIDVGVDVDRSIQLRCDNRMVFTIPFDVAYRAHSEAAHFVAGENLPMAVW